MHERPSFLAPPLYSWTFCRFDVVKPYPDEPNMAAAISKQNAFQSAIHTMTRTDNALLNTIGNEKKDYISAGSTNISDVFAT